MDKQKLPYIAIVVIGYNEANNLDHTFQAINRINYPLEKLEKIYVDSGSTDNSVEIARTYTDKVFVESRNPSSGRNRNRGLMEARYDIVHFIDGDVIIHPDYLRNIVNLFDEKDAQAIVGQLDEQNPNIFNKLAALSNVEKKEGYTRFTSTGATYLKHALLSVNGYDERIRRGQETELGDRFRNAGYKIWCTGYEMGSHNFGINSVQQLFKKEFLQGKSNVQVALMKGEGSFFNHAKKVLRNQLIKAAFLLLVILVSFFLGKPWLILIYLLLSSLYQYRSLLKKVNNRNVNLVVISFLLKFIGQFYYLGGMFSELFKVYFKRKEAQLIALEKEILVEKHYCT